MKQNRCEINHSTPSSAEILKERNFTYTLSLRLHGATLLNSQWCLECAANRRDIIIKKGTRKYVQSFDFKMGLFQGEKLSYGLDKGEAVHVQTMKPYRGVQV